MQDSDLDERAMTRQVLAEQAAGWAPIYRAALAMQERNPDLRAMAEQCPTDGPAGARRLIPLLALAQHPQVLRSCVAWCDFVAGELWADVGVGILVRGRREDPDVSGNAETGDGQQCDRAVTLEERVRQLEEWNAQQEEAIFALRSAIAQAVRPTNTA